MGKEINVERTADVEKNHERIRERSRPSSLAIFFHVRSAFIIFPTISEPGTGYRSPKIMTGLLSLSKTTLLH